MKPIGYLNFVFPKVETENNYYKLVRENAEPKKEIRLEKNDEKVLMRAVKENEPPLKSTYLRIIKKYGYTYPVSDNVLDILSALKGVTITDDVIREVNETLALSRAYNPFLVLGTCRRGGRPRR